MDEACGKSKANFGENLGAKMSQNLRNDSVFHKPGTPKNTWQLFSWLIFEPILLERYGNTLDKRQTAFILLKAYLYIIVISITLYLMMCFITVVFNMPHLFPTQYKRFHRTIYVIRQF